MATYVESDYHVVDLLEALPSKKLRFTVLKNGEDVLYGIIPDKSSKNTTEKIMLFEQRLLMEDFITFVISEEGKKLWSLLVQNSIYGYHFRSQLPPITREILLHTYQQLVFESLIRNNLKLRFPSIIPTKEIRLSKTAFDYQNLRNALAIYLAPFPHILQLSGDYRRQLSSSDGGHADRVHGIFPCRLSDLFSLSRATGKERKRYFLHLLYHNYALSEFISAPVGEVKVNIHFHVDEVIFPGVCEKWHGIFAHWRHLYLNIRSLRSSASDRGTANPSNASWGDLSVLLTFFVNKSGSRVEIDVPGGKRDLGETPLQCMHREVWEEIGFHPAMDSIPWTQWMVLKNGNHKIGIDNNYVHNNTENVRNTATSDDCDTSNGPKWVVLQQEEDPTITSFLLCETDFATRSLLPSFLSATAASQAAPITEAEMSFPYSAEEATSNELVTIFSQLAVDGNRQKRTGKNAGKSANLEKNR